MSVSGMWFLSAVWMLSLNLFSHPSVGPETVQSVEQNFIVFNKDIAPLRRARLSLALIYTNLTLDAPCLLVFCNLPTPRPGPLGQERLPALLIWAQIAPHVGDLPGAEVGWPRLAPCRDIGMSLCHAPQVAAFPFCGISQQSDIIFLPPMSTKMRAGCGEVPTPGPPNVPWCLELGSQARVGWAVL